MRDLHLSMGGFVRERSVDFGPARGHPRARTATIFGTRWCVICLAVYRGQRDPATALGRAHRRARCVAHSEVVALLVPKIGVRKEIKRLLVDPR
jgi:hypothetical protein